MSFQTVSRVLLLALSASVQFQALEYTATLQSKDSPAKPNATGTAACTIVMLSDTEGVKFDEYLLDVYQSVKKRWFAKMPASIEKGQQGISVVELRILRDGNLDKDSVKIFSSSAKSDFDSASLQAIREAAPFKHLPEAFSKPHIDLRFNFYYNLPLPKNPH